MRFTLRLLIVALLLWSGWACTDTLVDVVDVAAVEIEPDDVALTPGQSQQLQARVRDAQGNILSGRSIQWSSNAEGVASVSPNGMVSGVSAGGARIAATSEGVQGTADVTVSAAPVILAQSDSVPLEAVIDETETAVAAIAITNGGGGTLAGLAAAIEYDSSTGDWLDAELSGTAAPVTLSVTADADGLARGTYRASVRLTSTSIGAAPIVVRVVFTVLQRSPAPTLVSVTPNRSAREQSLDIIMTGSGFVPGLTTVSFGSGITVSNVNVEGPTTLTASITVGATAAVGTRTVSVINPAPGGGTASIADAFTVEGLNPRPTITSVEPATAQRQSTLDVTIVGTGFLDDVTLPGFGVGITINSLDVTSATALTANITIGAGAATGTRDITVTNPAPGGGVGTLRDAFTVTAANPAPTLTSVSPASAQRLETITVQLTGGNFATGLTTIDFGAGITVSGMMVVSATTITADITIDAAAALGARAVSVTNAGPGGGTATLATGFTVLDANPAPVVQAVAPASGRLAQTLDVVVTGTGFVDGVTTIEFGAGITVNTTSVADPTSLTANISVAGDATLGVRSVTATNAAPGGGTDTLADAFTVFGAVSADLSTVTTAPSTNVAANDTAVSTVTVVVRDAASGAVTGLAPDDFTLSVTGNATPGAIAETATPGTYQFTVSNTVAETVIVNVTADDVALTDAPTITFVATVVSAANSTVSADPLTGITADGVAASVVTVELRDANDNPIVGLAETAFAITVGDNATASAITETATDGTYTFTVVNTVAETVTVGVSAGGTALNETPVITFVPGAGSAAHSSAIVPDGTAGAVTPISITVQDASGNPVTGAAAALAVSITGANTATPAVTDNADGTYAAEYTPTVAGSDDIAIALAGEEIAGSPFASVVSAGGASAPHSSAAVPSGTAGSVTTSVITVRDANSNPVIGQAAGIAVSISGGNVATPAIAETGGGEYAASYTPTIAGTDNVAVTLGGSPLVGSPFASVVSVGAPSAANSSAVVPNGTAGSTTTIVLTVRDGANNLVAGQAANLAVSVTGVNTATPAVTETGGGSYSASYTPTAAGQDELAITLGGTPISGSPYTSNVITGDLSPANSTAVVPDGTSGSTTEITITVRDVSNNPVSGQAAGLIVSVTGSNIVTPPVTETGDGSYSASYTPTAAGSDNVVITLGGAPITGSPFTSAVSAGAASAASSSATVPGGTAGSATAITITVRDANNNPVTGQAAGLAVSITGSNTATPAVTETGDGLYDASYTPTAAGSDDVAITLGDVAIAGSPYTSAVSAGAASADQSSATVPGGTAGSATAITITVLDANSNPVTGQAANLVVSITGSNTATPTVTETGDGLYDASYTPTAAGSDDVAIAVDGVAIAGSPYASAVSAGAASAAQSSATVPGGTAGNATAITITVLDANSNPVTGQAANLVVSITGSNTATPTVTETRDGLYDASYTPTAAGSDDVAIALDGVAIAGSPYTSAVSAGVASADQSSATVPEGTAGSETNITITVLDANSNPVTGQAADLAVSITGSNTATPTVTETDDGLYSANYTPTAAGTDNVAITLGGVAITDSPYTSAVSVGAASAAHSSAMVPGGTAGSETIITITVLDANSNPVTGEAANLEVSITGSNTATATVTETGEGAYSATYTPTVAGTDDVAITLGGVAIAGGPYASAVQ